MWESIWFWVRWDTERVAEFERGNIWVGLGLQAQAVGRREESGVDLEPKN